KRSLEVVEADERTAQGQERLMDILAPFIADAQAPIAIEPRQGALNHPAVSPQPLAGLDPLARDPHRDMAASQCLSTARDIVGLVGAQLGRPLPGTTTSPPNGPNGVDDLLEHGAVVAVGPGRPVRQRGAHALDDHVACGAGFAAIGGIRSHGLAPLFAGTLALSRAARSQSIWSAAPSRSSRVWCTRSQTPASCQSRR